VRGDQLQRGTGEACFRMADAGETTKLTSRARVAVTEEEGVIVGLRKLKEAAFGKYTKAVQAGIGRARAWWSAVRSGPARARLGRVG
jgi:hypothetical protein